MEAFVQNLKTLWVQISNILV